MESTLKITTEETAPCHYKLHVEVPAEQVDETFKALEKKYNKEAKLPGFRPGKVPRSMIWKQFGEQLRNQATEQLLQENVKKAMDQEKLSPESQVIPADETSKGEKTASPGEPLSFAVEFDVEPEFELPDYRNIALAEEKAEVDEEEVERLLEEVLSNRKTFEKVERPAQLEDMLKADYRAQIDDEELEQYPESAKFILRNQSGWLALRDPEILPGIKQSLEGVEAGENREVSIEFPEDFFEKSLAGNSLQYSVQVHEVHAPKTPELNDELAKEVGAESAEDLRRKARAHIEQQRAQEIRRRQRQEIENALLDSVDMTLPPHALAQRTSEIYMEMTRRESEESQAQDESEADGEQPVTEQKSDEEKQREADELARKGLRRKLILRKIAEKEGVTVEQQEFQSMLQSLSRYHNMEEGELLERLRNSGRIIDFLDDIRESKTLDHLVSLLTGEKSEAGEGEGTESSKDEEPQADSASN